tara:strand:+ start:114 stop:1034 length:921 start_codon:yes stop_codon:yes gene_type:complete
MKNSFYKKSTLSRLKSAPTVFRLMPAMAKKSPYGQGSKHNMTYRMPSVDEIFDAENRRNRKIQYVLGEESIYAKEQSENPVLQDIIFVNGILIVQPQQVNLLNYLEISNYNKSNPNRMPSKASLYYKVDVEADTKDTVEDMEVEADALYIARSMEPQKLVGYARTLGINVDRSMYEIKHDVMSFAKENPSVFLKSIDDPRTERKQVVLDAVDYGILDFGHHANEVNWVMGTKRPTIIHTPVGVEKIDYFVEYTFDSEGEDVYKEIQKRMKKIDSIDEEEVDIPEMKEVVVEEEVIVKKKPTKKKVK